MPRIRRVITITVAPITDSENFPFVEQVTGLPRGRIVDYLVEKEMKRLKKLNAGASKTGEA